MLALNSLPFFHFYEKKKRKTFVKHIFKGSRTENTAFEKWGKGLNVARVALGSLARMFYLQKRNSANKQCK